jgi:hypothetical protein
MNVIDRPSKIVGTLIGEPSFADAMAAIEKANELSPAQKRHWPTSLRQTGGYLNRPLRSEAISEVDIERLDEIRLSLEQYRSSGLTEKNRKLIRQIAQSDVWREVVRLPQRLMAEARINAKTKPYRAAVTAQLAIAILILIRAPVRMQNLSSILIGINLVRPGGSGARLTCSSSPTTT